MGNTSSRPCACGKADLMKKTQGKKTAPKKTTAQKKTARKSGAKNARGEKTVTKRVSPKNSGPSGRDTAGSAGGDWRSATLARVRALMHEAVPDVVEELKWRGVPTWSSHGIICTGETYKEVVKLTFMKGAALIDPAKLFNSSLEGNARRAIDIRIDAMPGAQALKDLFRAAAALNKKTKEKK